MMINRHTPNTQRTLNTILKNNYRHDIDTRSINGVRLPDFNSMFEDLRSRIQSFYSDLFSLNVYMPDRINVFNVKPKQWTAIKKDIEAPTTLYVIEINIDEGYNKSTKPLIYKAVQKGVNLMNSYIQAHYTYSLRVFRFKLLKCTEEILITYEQFTEQDYNV